MIWAFQGINGIYKGNCQRWIQGVFKLITFPFAGLIEPRASSPCFPEIKMTFSVCTLPFMRKALSHTVSPSATFCMATDREKSAAAGIGQWGKIPKAAIGWRQTGRVKAKAAHFTCPCRGRNGWPSLPLQRRKRIGWFAFAGEKIDSWANGNHPSI